MSNPIFLQIPEACHQDWDKMTAQDKGRFCGSCQKTVVDFTTMSDQQVLNFFNTKTDQNTCGRFTNEQLNKSYQEPPIPKSNWYKWVAAFVASGMFGSLKTHAQGRKIATEKIQFDIDSVIQKKLRTVPTDADSLSKVKAKESPLIHLGGVRSIPQNQPTCIITGAITDKNAAPIPFSNITIRGTKKVVVTDASGKYSIQLDRLPTDLKLITSLVGYETKETSIDPNQIISLDVVRHNLNMRLKNIEMEAEVSSALQGKLGGVFAVEKITKKDTMIALVKKIFTGTAFKISPNPVQPGSNIQLVFKKNGQYDIELLNIESRLIARTAAVVAKAGEPVGFLVPLTAAGNYFIRVTDSKAKKQMVEKIMIY